MLSRHKEWDWEGLNNFPNAEDFTWQSNIGWKKYQRWQFILLQPILLWDYLLYNGKAEVCENTYPYTCLIHIDIHKKACEDFSKLSLGNDKQQAFRPNWDSHILLAVGILGHTHFFYHFSSLISESNTDNCSLEKLLLSSLSTELLHCMIFGLFSKQLPIAVSMPVICLHADWYLHFTLEDQDP